VGQPQRRHCHKNYGFKAEIPSQFDNPVYHVIMAAVIDGSIFCVRRGIGLRVKSIEETGSLKRPSANANLSCIGAELFWWHDNEAIARFDDPPGNRRSAVCSFLAENNLKSILRALQCLNGLHHVPGTPVATIFSSSASHNAEPPKQSGIVVVPWPSVEVLPGKGGRAQISSARSQWASVESGINPEGSRREGTLSGPCWEEASKHSLSQEHIMTSSADRIKCCQPRFVKCRS
jgi:hypothetical protein